MDIPRFLKTAAPHEAAPGRARKRRLRAGSLFLATVVLPTLAALVYFGLVASDIYTSESRFVVRNPQRQATPGIGAVLQGAGFARAQDDTHSVVDFMQSRDALRELDTRLALGRGFGAGEVDLFARFDPLGLDDSFEALHRYYGDRLEVQVDSTSSITTLKTTAFSARDARAMNAALLDMAERLVNTLNERARQDMIRFASSEVAAAARQARAAAQALSDFRIGERVFDPDRQSALQLQHVARLQDELIAAKAQLVQLRTAAPQNPQLPALQARADALAAEIAAANGKVAGGGASLAAKTAQYERLVLERSVADKQLAGALAALEQARNEAQRQQLYLERIVQPNTPDVATRPRRLRAVLATFLLGLMAWGILSVLAAGLREHHD